MSIKRSIAEEVAERILQRMKEVEEAIQNGDNEKTTVFRWVKPFSIGAPNLPYSFETLKAYNGINRLILPNNEFLTFRMVQDLNQKSNSPQYQIRKGAKSSPLFFFKVEPVIDKETGKVVIDEITGQEKTRGIWKRYNVFCREDVVRRDTGEVLPSKFNFEHFSHDDITERMKIGLDRFNRLFNYFCQKHGIEVEIVKDGTQAYFSRSDMKIRAPEMSNFKSVYDWITTLAHELAHSTGVFLDRFKEETMMPEEARTQYAREELVAEIASQSIANILMIEDDSEITSDNAVAYIHSWSSFLKDKPHEILTAAKKADKAVEMITDTLREMELAEQQTEIENNEKEEEER